MKSDRALYLDSKGRLCDAPPSSGIKIASIAGVEIPAWVEKEHHLSIKDGCVVQNGKDPTTPKSTPDPLIADRRLWITAEGKLVDEEPTKGIKIAEEGDKIPAYYVSEHNLFRSNGRIGQKGRGKPEDKQRKKPKNKSGSGLTINRGSD